MMVLLEQHMTVIIIAILFTLKYLILGTLEYKLFSYVLQISLIEMSLLFDKLV